MLPGNTIEVSNALAEIDGWCRDSRWVKVGISDALTLIESGWGGATRVDDNTIRVVYKRDQDAKEVDQTFDLTGAVASRKSIWDATPQQQQRFGHLDAAIMFVWPSGRTLLLACAESPEQTRN